MSNELTVNKGEIIFQEGDRAEGFYIVAAGKIKVFKMSFEGKEQILHIYGPGHTFGEVPVFQGKSFPASAMALELSTILFLPRQAFVQQIGKSPALAMNMLADLSRRLREFTVQIENLSLKEVPARLAAYILTLAQEGAGHSQMVPLQKKSQKARLPSASVSLPVSKVQLASLIGTTPETISRVLKKMGQAGFIKAKGKKILIPDQERLEELSHTGRL
ncbi:Crp/Fnr family transcriptional regulator [Desulfobacter hydrogenophilus]|uniref:Crp/Fnr family transcriptional regulator n=1 Tax=Desulfobacter hydrogenophilus TaxID=2291 RepID=A0A328FHM2_9BACT|nr:Crp/Fnr family transcriptional regulator [Desulfobacter hydrogenophilus]NDY71076.1 Crp/Fnr family transcriptional regulator [Desulfobacter hydrogenophilus]QBH15487.1 Crp/Fnr family transcriptional regulator [Desulfobacter hydrogenophilus]RAM02972.1 Crp/Fnr family transcriptional regulator [Desulfobacter hydrogenophilus]